MTGWGPHRRELLRGKKDRKQASERPFKNQKLSTNNLIFQNYYLMTTHALKPVQAARRHLYWPLRTVWKGHTQILMARTPGPKNHALKFRVATSFYLFGFACWLYSVHIWYNHCLVFWCLRIARFNAKSIIELSHFWISKMQKIDFYLTDTNV